LEDKSYQVSNFTRASHYGFEMRIVISAVGILPRIQRY